jgi:hypothetical protein
MTLQKRTMSAETRAKVSATLKGHEVTAETRAKISATKRTNPSRAGGNKPTPIQTPDGIFDSVKAYATYAGIKPITVYKRIKAHPGIYYFL